MSDLGPLGEQRLYTEVDYAYKALSNLLLPDDGSPHIAEIVTNLARISYQLGRIDGKVEGMDFARNLLRGGGGVTSHGSAPTPSETPKPEHGEPIVTKNPRGETIYLCACNMAVEHKDPLVAKTMYLAHLQRFSSK